MTWCGGRSCFTSPLTRAKQTADIVWAGRQGKLIETDSLAEAYLGFLQGMSNSTIALPNPLPQYSPHALQ